MNRTASASIAGHLGTLLTAGSAAALSDAQLLERVTAGTKAAAAAQAAFEVLVARHGPMVLGVCRRGLADTRDVEDAFQATFLVLVRKSASVRIDDSLGRWLYGVARRVVRRAHVAAERRRIRERPHAGVGPIVAPQDAERAELLAVLDDELARLPERLRAPLVLCYLEGLSHTEAAARLRWPAGTVKGRLAQGRSLLRGRLTRRGLAPSALALSAALEAQAGVVLPPALMQRTVASSVRFALGGSAASGPLSGSVMALTKGTLNAMLAFRLKVAAACLLATLEIAATATALGHDANAEGTPATPAARTKPDEGRAAVALTADEPRGIPVISQLKEPTAITFLVADGSRVQKGEVICKLDSAALERTIANQKTIVSSAEAAYRNARLAREVAEIAVKEYTDGSYKSEMQSIMVEISRADGEVKRAAARLEWSDKMLEKGFVSLAQNVGDKVSFQEKKFAFQQMVTKKSVLEKYTYDKTVKQLNADVEKARSGELAKQAAWNVEKEKLAQTETELVQCQIEAPVTGRLVYVRWRMPGRDGRRAKLLVGDLVRWRQLLFRIVTDAN